MATATAETLSRAAILLRQLLLVPTPLRRAPTPRLAAAMAVVAGLQGAQVAAASRVVLVVEAARVVVEVAAVTAAVVGAATAVAATDQRAY